MANNSRARISYDIQKERPHIHSTGYNIRTGRPVLLLYRSSSVYMLYYAVYRIANIYSRSCEHPLPGMFFISGLKILLPISYAASVTCSIMSTLIRNKNYDELGKPGKTPGMTVREEHNTLRQKKSFLK